MTGSKTAIKTARPSPRSGVSLPLGAHPGNTGGKKGRSGRKPGPFKAFLAEVRVSQEFRDAVKAASSDPNSRNFGAALKLVADYDEEKPAEKKELSGKLEMVVRVEREGRRITR